MGEQRDYTTQAVMIKHKQVVCVEVEAEIKVGIDLV